MTTVAFMDCYDDTDVNALDIKGVYCPPCAEIVASQQSKGEWTADYTMTAMTADELAEEFEDADGYLCDRCHCDLRGEGS